MAIDWNNESEKISKWFTVGEVTKGDPARVPTNPEHIRNILNLAVNLDRAREAWGGPIGVTSWYRPPAVNRRVGGARNSQHLNGGAADIYPIGGDIYAFQKWLDQYWFGRLGYGARRGFVHVDIANGKGFRINKDGGQKGARWNY